MAATPRSADVISPSRLVKAWQDFAEATTVFWRGHTRSWQTHIEGDGFEDEVQLIQPTIFPAFCRQFLDWEVGVNLSPEQAGNEGRPDFTPADPVTHPFVFDTKSSRKGTTLNDPLDLGQVRRYLVQGRPRIRKVVLTNLVGLRVFELDDRDDLREIYDVRLRDLLILGEQSPSAATFARFIQDFSRRELSRPDKIARVRQAHPWNPLFEVTASDWVMRRLDDVVSSVERDVLERISTVLDPTILSEEEGDAILGELHLLGSRLADNLTALTLADFVQSRPGTTAHLAVEQYAMHVAYYTATRLLVVRTWEDLGLLEPTLYDGGFDRQMDRFDDVIGEVVENAFRKARYVYRSLFRHSNNYSWFVPSPDVYADAVYELGFTYLGRMDTDVLGQVYERLLARIDRKLLGQYYTPRDIVRLIWDLIGLDEVAERAEAEGRAPRVLDIATGSGGFLVEAASRLRARLAAQQTAGAGITSQEWLNSIAEGLNGVEIQYFSRYLAELNLLVQIGQLVATDPSLRIAPMGVVAADTLSLHEPDDQPQLVTVPADQPERAAKIKNAIRSDFAMDVACGNPPYIGEKLAAPLLNRARQQYPYWEQFVAEHLDYLYWFLIVGVSKLRQGGRFGFITTEYWLRASGARPLREYLSRHCSIERIVLFRDLRLFPDAPGQHSMVIVGTRVTSPVGDAVTTATTRAKVSIYEGPHISSPRDRGALLDAVREARTRYPLAGVRSFSSSVSPNELGGRSWAEIILTQSQVRQRARLTGGPQVDVKVSKGVETTLNTLTKRTAARLSQEAQRQASWPARKPGIQLLTSDDVSRLGELNDAERRVLRPVLNTRDVFPYAGVLPADADRVVYLAKPSDMDPGSPPDADEIDARFPTGFPAIQRHLEQFRPVLEHATRDRGESRPWWTLHRPRYKIIGPGSQGAWEAYCVTTRWGGGGRLIVGLAPGRASPASGLHILRPRTPNVPAEYLTALYNSTVFQAIVDTLPPGNLRAEQLVAIGAPLLPSDVKSLCARAMDLAELVRDLVTYHAVRFPLLRETLRNDVTLRDLPTDVWSMTPGPPTSWGRLADVAWVREVAPLRSLRRSLGHARMSDSLFGRAVEMAVRGDDIVAVRVELDPSVPIEVHESVLAMLRGAAASGTIGAEVGDLLVPVDPLALVAEYDGNVDELTQRVDEYRRSRIAIDAVLESALAAG